MEVYLLDREGYKLAKNQKDLTPLQIQYLLMASAKMNAIEAGKITFNDSLNDVKLDKNDNLNSNELKRIAKNRQKANKK